ncbi:outer membrane lipoprotein carrier protein LolA [Vibrio makurazakiensis]|uniref:LolA family protein n=1 Tax=Vibrio makurazakiensis TaxID=2910250 RepID=UPI003D0C593C
MVSKSFRTTAFACLLAMVPLSSLASSQQQTSVPSETFSQLNDVQQALASHSLVRGEFTQTRNMEMFSQPLTSKGRFLLDKENGLLWDQTAPFPVKLVLTKDKLSQKFADQTPQIITAKENPMAFYFSHIFLSVFHGDTEQLKQQFDLIFSPSQDTHNQWELKLSPKAAPLSSVFNNIILVGNSDIEKITLEEVRGDSTVIEFTNQTHLPEALTHAEKAQFQF